MKKIFTFLSGIVLAGIAISNANGQVFSVASDTVWFTQPTSPTVIYDRITVPGTSPVMIKWEVDPAGTNFPTDWITDTFTGASTAFCDNNGCYPSSIIPAASIQTTSYPTGTGDFHMNINLVGVTTTTGSYYITVKFTTSGVTPSQTAFETFISYPPSLVPTVKNTDEVLVYPNPATSSVNVVYDASLDIKNVAIYNIIGKMVSIYKVTGNSANLNTENLNSGFYFIRLINSHGDVVLTRKFTKQ